MITQYNSNFQKFLLLWAGELISAVGSGLTAFGLGVYVFDQTGSASATALITLLAFLPALLLSAPAGVLADRYDRRLLMMIGDGLSALGLVFILVCMHRRDALLWQICLGVTISSVFSSLLEPAYKATVTDLLTPDQYTKASGLVSAAGSAKYLISPVIAGYLLTVSDIRLLLLLDIATFFVTAAATLAVRKSLPSRHNEPIDSFLHDLKAGYQTLRDENGIFVLVLTGMAITFFLGIIQTLFSPLMLAFTGSATLGTVITICASGMLVSSLVLGMIPLRKGYAGTLSLSLFLAGIFMAGFGLRENTVLICISGFLFFAMLPFANTALDYMLRSRIKNEYQGRAWGIIGVISQLGYVAAYAVSGVLADGIGSRFRIGVGRGAGWMIMIAGLLLSVTSIILYQIISVRSLGE